MFNNKRLKKLEADYRKLQRILDRLTIENKLIKDRLEILEGEILKERTELDNIVAGIEEYKLTGAVN